MSIEYRHPTMADIKAVTDVINQSGRELPLHRDNTVDEIMNWTFKDDDYDEKGYLVAVFDGQIVGFGGSMISKARLESGYSDSSVRTNVIPEHRGKGIEQHLVNHALDYLRSKGIGKAKRWCYTTSGWQHDLSLEFGMKDVRHSYTMIYDKQEFPPEIRIPGDIKFDHIMTKESSDGQIEEFVKTFNETFQDHWSFSPVPVKIFIKFRDIREEITRMSFAKKGEETIAVLLCEISTLYNEQNDAKTGWANILGVKKAHRRQGLGRALLSDGVRWLMENGLDTVYLGMDAENQKALDLYTDIGFRIEQEAITYELKL